MSGKSNLPRRDFLKQAAGAIGAATQAGHWTGTADAQTRQTPGSPLDTAARTAGIAYPRIFEGRQLKMISFPLGGVAAGSLGLGGRGQLRDWEIFNRPNQGFSPPYAFPAIWVQSGNFEAGRSCARSAYSSSLSRAGWTGSKQCSRP